MIFQFHLKKLIRVKNRILNFQRLKNATLVKEMAQNQVILLTDVLIVVEMEK